MTSTMMMDRTGMGMPGMGMPGMSSMPGMGTAPMAPNMMMVPRCKMTVEKMSGGMKMTCVCDDAVARAMMQNLCTMLAGGMCSCTCMMNGMVCCNCNLVMGMCKTEMTKDGCIVTCTSGARRGGLLLRLHPGLVVGQADHINVSLRDVHARLVAVLHLGGD